MNPNPSGAPPSGAGLPACASAEGAAFATLRPGFRLSRLELLNWGTFHKQVWGLDAGSNNALVTGDIGSGKSTLVDAIAALLVPRVSFNKAAGASPGERSLESYFFGRYKAERGEPGLASKPVSLRDAGSYSVLLARFHNEALSQTVTLAQVFWAKAPSGPPARMYVVADSALSIREHFAAFGSNIDRLKKRLRALPAAETFETFPPYASAFRHRFGIENEQALDLFHQTISMKSVGNLTDFVRDHMLEAFPVRDRIDALTAHYQDLDRAHELVLKAKFQVGFLGPVVEDCDRRSALAAEVEMLRACRDALRPWFASKKKALLERRIADQDAQLEKLAHRIAAAEEARSRLRRERDGVRQAIAEHGGDRIERIKQEIAEAQARKDERATRAARYDARARDLGFPAASDADTFLSNRRAIEAAAADAEAAEARAQNALTEAGVELRQLQEQFNDLTAELESLRNRRSNIPRNMLELRAELCRAAGLRETELPFAGELLEVRQEARDWEGAIERLLHNFGLSLLTPDTHYARVAEWVDRTHLHGRLVYFRVLKSRPADRAPMQAASLAHKIAIKPDSAFYDWLDSEVAFRFNLVCCDSLDQFRREPQAITRAGQIKGRGERHEKDDRHAVGDRSRYVLGWSNERKIEALETARKQLEARRVPLVARIAILDRERSDARSRKTKLAELGVFESFRELDWRPLAVEIERLDGERRALEEGSDILKTLQRQLAAIDHALDEAEKKLRADHDEQARLTDRRAAALKLAEECAALIEHASGAQRKAFAPLEGIAAEAPADRPLTVENCDNRERDMREALQTRIDAEDKKIRVFEEKIVRAMQSYRSRFPLETQEVDASVEAADEYRAMLRKLQDDDLPRFEQHFKSLLNENTIREVANFQSQLNRERETIRERIETINRSLHGIDYNPGRYILLEASPNPDPEVRDFRDALRSCTEGTLGASGGAEYSEEKFEQVKRIIVRFRGREGSTEIDRRWTEKVTDVRQWFTFSASERYREDDGEFEHYTDSGGKSGGQKEKLAYTVLAASLAYQFGLEADAARPRSFRFVVIDEAFGRGSDESARYGLKLFERLDLQLLIVTPLQKIHIIEPFIANVGFVHNEDGRLSMLRNLTIAEYRAERARRTGQAAEPHAVIQSTQPEDAAFSVQPGAARHSSRQAAHSAQPGVSPQSVEPDAAAYAAPRAAPAHSAQPGVSTQSAHPDAAASTTLRGAPAQSAQPGASTPSAHPDAAASTTLRGAPAQSAQPGASTPSAHPDAAASTTLRGAPAQSAQPGAFTPSAEPDAAAYTALRGIPAQSAEPGVSTQSAEPDAAAYSPQQGLAPHVSHQGAPAHSAPAGFTPSVFHEAPASNPQLRATPHSSQQATPSVQQGVPTQSARPDAAAYTAQSAQPGASTPSSEPDAAAYTALRGIPAQSAQPGVSTPSAEPDAAAYTALRHSPAHSAPTGVSTPSAEPNAAKAE